MNMTPQQISQKLAQQLQSGQFGPAAKLAKTALKKFPRESHFANVAGTAFANDNKPLEAIRYFQKALQLAPWHEEYQNNLVHAYIVARRHDKAQELAEKLAAKRSDPASLYHLIAFSKKLQGDCHGVITAATAGLAQGTSERLNLLVLRGEAYFDLNNQNAARADLEAAHEIAPHAPETVEPLSHLYLDIFEPDQALAILHNALAVHGDDPNLLTAQATALNTVGRLDEGKAALQKALDIAPTFASAWMLLAQNVSRDQALAALPEAQAALSAHGTGTQDWAWQAMAIGNLHFKAGQYDKAGAFLAKGKGALSKLFPHDPKAATLEFEQITAATPKGPAPVLASRPDVPRALFVVGQPRSGTTLTEMVLSAHPDVVSCGEMGGIDQAWQAQQAQDIPFDAATFEATYRATLPAHATGARAFADKMPSNYRFVGPILQGIAGAKVIHIERDPRDVALSMWRQVFSSDWMRFTNDLKHMAHMANLYRRYMLYWQETHGGQFLSIRYADLVSDIEGTSRKMAAFCELDWVPAMMSPQDNAASVRTASVTQVREGVHAKSVGGWHRMEDALRPFIKGLDPALWPELDL